MLARNACSGGEDVAQGTEFNISSHQLRPPSQSPPPPSPHLGIMVINEVQVDPVFAHGDECLPKLELVQATSHAGQYQCPRANSLKITTWHLREGEGRRGEKERERRRGEEEGERDSKINWFWSEDFSEQTARAYL